MNNPRLAFRVGMKLVGLWAVLYGGMHLVLAVASAITRYIWSSQIPIGAGFDLVAWLAPYAVLLIAGLYLLLGGRWVLGIAFAGGPGACIECGYPMDRSSSQHCPECGARRTEPMSSAESTDPTA